MRVSIVVPVFNEDANVMRLHRAITGVMEATDHDYEILYVNDGSTDNSATLLDTLVEDQHVRVVHFRRNFGQTAAMSAGLEHARGDAIVTLDADLQNEPADIPRLLEKLEAGYDLVSGWRKDRQDTWLTRKLPSLCANWLIARVTGFPVKDLGCTLKAMRSGIARDLNLYGEMHRFIPILANWQGARCTEIETTHHPRLFGQTKYGLSRTFRVLLDLVTVKYLIQYSNSPMRLFGSIGLVCSGISLVSAVAVMAMKLSANFDMSGNPLLYVTLFGFMIALQFFSLGMLGEMSARIYYESQGRKPYAVRHTLGTGLQDEPAELTIRRAA